VTAPRALRVAIVGAGPSGFYAAGALMAAKEPAVEVDVIERLPTPWGLVRGGVAPDHPKIKSVTRVYERTAQLPGVRYFGNLEVGRDVQHEELVERFDAVLYAVGTAEAARGGIPGEDLPGSHSAGEFVGWYNGHPDHRGLEVDLSARRAIVIGNGNVAVDVARMLCLPADELAQTDIADHALEALAGSRIAEVVMLGRRGPEQAAFTNPELRELGELTDTDIVVDPRELDLAPDIRETTPSSIVQRNLEILGRYARRPSEGNRRRIVLRFLASPLEILGDTRVEAVRLAANELVRGHDGRLLAARTPVEQVLEAGLVIRAIGYRGAPIPGLPFDESRGTIPNESGRVVRSGVPVPGAYVAGWIKRGPSGVIGTNKKCAAETVAALLEDAATGALADRVVPDAQATADFLARRSPRVVGYEGWEAIDLVEREAGASAGRPRVKITQIAGLLEAAEVDSDISVM
jgi:ferredoxin/flavodoxin---NADP+ reductase